MAYLKVLSQHFSKMTEDTQDKSDRTFRLLGLESNPAF